MQLKIFIQQFRSWGFFINWIWPATNNFFFFFWMNKILFLIWNSTSQRPTRTYINYTQATHDTTLEVSIKTYWTFYYKTHQILLLIVDSNLWKWFIIFIKILISEDQSIKWPETQLVNNLYFFFKWRSLYRRKKNSAIFFNDSTFSI